MHIFLSTGLPSIPIPLQTFQICVFKQHIPLNLGFTSISLFYGTTAPYSFCLARESGTNYLIDLLAFLFIIYLAWNSGSHSSGLPSLLKVMAEDATLYFLVIFTSHLVLELTLIFGSVSTSSRRSISLSFAETFVAFDKTTPWSVSDITTYRFRLSADPLSTEQRKCRVR